MFCEPHPAASKATSVVVDAQGPFLPNAPSIFGPISAEASLTGSFLTTRQRQIGDSSATI
jgi:hypothetical protein